MTTRTASCSCGQLTATTSEDSIRISVCHCLECQRRTGSVFGTQARFRREAVTIRGESKRYVRTSDKGNKCVFNFCPHCGATVHYENEGSDGIVAIPVGAFAEPGFPGPTISVYEEREHAWVGLPENIEHKGSAYPNR